MSPVPPAVTVSANGSGTLSIKPADVAACQRARPPASLVSCFALFASFAMSGKGW